MIYQIEHQERYSRGELLLRTLLGAIYIALPHMFVLLFVGLWSAILTFIAFWAILFTGRYPQSMYEFQVGLIRWNTRLNARLMNLSDGYPSFGIKAHDDHTDVQIKYPENLSRGMLILKVLFGVIYVGIPHGFILLFRYIFAYILVFLAFWAVLFTGKFPESWHRFIVGTLRWSTRVNLYLNLMTDDYPPFHGREDENYAGSVAAEHIEGAPTPSAPPAEDTPPVPPSPEEPDEGSTDQSDEDRPGDSSESSDEDEDDTKPV